MYRPNDHAFGKWPAIDLQRPWANIANDKGRHETYHDVCAMKIEAIHMPYFSIRG